jgi:hypothetical protein
MTPGVRWERCADHPRKLIAQGELTAASRRCRSAS